MIMTRRPTHPGRVLKYDVLEPMNITVTAAAKMLRVSRKTVSELINERIALSPDMAVRISIATNTTPEGWMNMQTKLDLWLASKKSMKVAHFPKAG
jgi:addiction module antidote protein, HigA family